MTTETLPQTTLNRMTALLYLYHEQLLDQPLSVEATFSKQLANQVEVYTRRLTLRKDWVPLELGWFDPDQVGYLLLQNVSGSYPLVNPTEEQRKDLSQRVIELTLHAETPGPEWCIAPGDFFFGATPCPATIYLRSRHETAQARVHLFPK